MNQNQVLDKTQRIEDRVKQVLESNFPVTIKNKVISIEDVTFERPKMFDADYEVSLKDNEGSLTGIVKASVVITDTATGKTVKSAKRTIMHLPYLTARGTYIIGGKEKIIPKQMLLKPGAYTYAKGDSVESLFFLEKGDNMRIEFDPEDANLKIGVKGKTFNAITFFRMLGITDSEIESAINDHKIAEQLFAKARTDNMDTAVRRMWDLVSPALKYFSNNQEEVRFRSKEHALDDIREYFFKRSEFGPTGTKVMNITLGHAANNPDKQVFLSTLSKIITIAKADTEDKRYDLSDDKDDIRFQNIESDEDQIEFRIQEGVKSFKSTLSRKLSKGDTVAPLDAFSSSSKDIGMGLDRFMSQGDLVDMIEQTNPLLMSAAQRKITSLGERGLTSSTAAQETRNLQNSTFGKLDPIETPESGKIGLVNHLTRNVEVHDRKIFSNYFKVDKGVFSRDDSNKIKVDSIDEYDKYIAFYDPNTFKVTNNVVKMPSEVWARHKGQLQKVSSKMVDYVDPSPHAIWGDAAAMIPFNSHDDGNRLLMGANMQKQALILANREEPLVQNATDESKAKTYEQVVADEQSFVVRSEGSGTVKKVTPKEIVVTTSKGDKTYNLLSYYPLNMSNYINNKPVVKVGDNVKSGQLLAEGWQTKNGTLALGMNARVAYMPWKGFNFEDGYVVSESFAKKMATEELKEIRVEVGEDMISGEGSNVKSFLAKLNVPASELAKLDDNGVIKVGSKVASDTILVGMVEEDKHLTDSPEYRLLKSLGTEIGNQYKDKSEVISGYINGEVIRVKLVPGGANDKFTAIITIHMSNPMKEGDKICGRHGNKGIITKIEKDEDMPIAEDGQPIEVIYSPLGVPSRKNLGQLYEVNAGLIASKTGKPWKVYNFDKQEAKKVMDGLKEIGFPDGKMVLTDPETGKPYENRVTVGVGYIMKLKHKVDDKIQSRTYGKTNFIYNTPVKSIGSLAGEKENPQKWGEYEMRALQSAKAVNLIDEAIKLKSDAAGDVKNRKEIFNALAFGNVNNVYGNVPKSLEIFKDYSMALGLNVKPLRNGKEVQSLKDNFNSLMISPIRPDEVRKMSRGEVTVAGGKNMYVTGDKAIKGGLCDPAIFGDTADKQSSYWGHIELALPLPNPMFMRSSTNPYTDLLGLKSTDLNRIVAEKCAVVADPKDTNYKKWEIVTLETAKKIEQEHPEVKLQFSGEALESMLKDINVDEEIRKTQEELLNPKNATNEKLYKKLRTLRMVKNNGIKPDDLLIKALPVLPLGLRPISDPTKGGEQINEDMNELYRQFIQVNDRLKEVRKDEKAWYVTEIDTKMKNVVSLYNNLTGIMGVNVKPIKHYNQELNGIAKKMSGKDGLIRGKLLSKQLDYSGRSVITVNPSLGLNECGVPVDMAATMYAPFVARELYVTGKAKSESKAAEKARNANDPDTIKALEKVMQTRPIILNRAPSLHKYSLQAFNPKLTKARAIEVNPLVVTGFNADFDGDTMATHVPLTAAGVREAEQLLMPSNVFINPTNGELAFPVKGESILGVYYLTIDKYKGKLITKDMAKKSFMSYDQLLDEYKRAKVSTYEIVMLNNIAATVGQHLINGILPDKYKDYRRVLNSKNTTKLVEQIIADDSKSDGKTKVGGTQEATYVLNKLKDLGFLASTKAALSIGLTDLKEDPNKDKLLADAEERVKKDPGSIVGTYYDVDEAMQSKIKQTLGEDNPMFIFMDSGAKGKSEQVSRMSNITGLSKDITGKVIPIPIVHSFKEGLTPSEMWVHAFDSRRGLADRSLSTAKPGELTRDIWSSTQDTLVTIDDCGDTEGTFLALTDKSLLGRFVAQGVRDNTGAVVVKRNTFIDTNVLDQLRSLKGVSGVYVRSPLTCHASKGICKKCYGAMPGTKDLPMIGEPVGILASQAIGEPTAQGVMKTFHGGGATRAAKERRTAEGIKRVMEVFSATSDPKNKSLLSPIDGRVLGVRKDILNKIIMIDGIDTNGKRVQKQIKVPLTKEILVNAGDTVERGQVLTQEGGAIAPEELLEYKGLRPTQDYMVNELADVLEDNNIDRKHLELAVSKLTDKVQVLGPSTSPWNTAQITTRNLVDKWNTEYAGKKVSVPITETLKLVGSNAAKTYKGFAGEVIVKEGDPITQEVLGKLEALRMRNIEVVPGKVDYKPVIYGVKSMPFRTGDNWFSQMGFQNIKVPYTEGAALGKVDYLDDPRAMAMAGKKLNIGEGYAPWKAEYDKMRKNSDNELLGLFD